MGVLESCKFPFPLHSFCLKSHKGFCIGLTFPDNPARSPHVQVHNLNHTCEVLSDVRKAVPRAALTPLGPYCAGVTVVNVPPAGKADHRRVQTGLAASGSGSLCSLQPGLPTAPLELCFPPVGREP